MNKILIIDDEPTIRMLLSRMLELEGYEVLKAKDRATAIYTLKNNEVQVVLCDVFLPDGNGVDMVQELQLLAPKAKIILLTANGNIPDGVQAIKNGAFDYIVKGDDNRKIIPIVSRAIDVIASENKKKKPSATTAKSHTFDTIVGKSTAISDVLRQAQKVATTDVTVLINGETGTGKEVFAQAIHNASHRSSEAFLALNCSAFSRELLESELFGYKAGAFTGAVKDKKGLLEEANHGTVFLDEIGEMALELQSKLLRVLETGEFVKVGDTKTTHVDVRILSATNRNLKEEIANGRFREDLYFRLSVFRIELPPLRLRKEDILPLAQHFIERYAKQIGCPPPVLSSEAKNLFLSYPWPGNVREMMNSVEHAIILCESEITNHDLPIDMLSDNTSAVANDSFDLKSVERNHIIKVLHHTHDNKTETARLLKIGLTTLYRKIEEYGITV
ncbi:Sigma-54 interaction domain protein [Prevotella disiens FB035-09AN]|uniref:Sigma-54 interaction domain protein n=1 Tax=Prevotella disiens FB035-09AN TaxID=866771 RepID=E1KPJ6_9BACT|nr:sigma-54 dependent transcriptional regulator [Prevotella disiens]EFL46601.1 Sigma-54 interaction domain protein [Prevotella disiens FB035-09AN]